MKTPFCSIIASLLAAVSASGDIVYHIGSSNMNWSVQWNAISSLNDAYDGNARREFDFVGDSTDAGAYWADTGTYVFFRFRVAYSNTVSLDSFSGAHLLLIDVDGYNYPSLRGSNTNGALPDYAFAWDSKSNNPLTHGFEMCVLSTRDNIWNGVNMDDIDGDAGKKLASDINGDGRTGDGYVRTVDGQATANFGLTTFIDYAVSWSYLTNYTALRQGQVWNIGLASINNATDHNNLNYDIGGGADPSSQTTVGWAPLGAIPEPAVVSLISLAGLLTLLVRRFKEMGGGL